MNKERAEIVEKAIKEAKKARGKYVDATNEIAKKHSVRVSFIRKIAEQPD